jgi:hypothetical protein
VKSDFSLERKIMTLRIKTTRVLRYIDHLKHAIAKRNDRFQSGVFWIATASVSSFSQRDSRKLWMLTLILFLVPLAFQFAALQFAFLTVLGFSVFSLSVTRLANSFLRVARI